MKNRDLFLMAVSKESSAQAPPPCELYDCQHFMACKSEMLACEAFHRYVVTGRSRPGGMPTRERYLKIYKEEDA